MRNHVRIHAAPPGTAPFTSSRKAEYYVKRGDAFMNLLGELEFIRPAGFIQRLQDAEFERAFTEGRGERVWWNGSAGSRKTKKPGQVRS